jgi:sugar phosphate permease
MGTEDAIPSTPVPLGARDLAHPTRVRYQVLIALCVLGLVAYVQRVGFASTGVGLKADLRLSGEQWGVLMAVFLGAYAGFEIPWGLLGDRLGARHLLAVLVLSWSLLTAALALVGLAPAAITFAVLLVLRFLFGLFQAGCFPAISRALCDWLPSRERATGQGLLWMCCRAGGAVAPFLVLTHADGSPAWRESFVLLGAMGVLWCAAFWPWFRDRPEQMTQVNAAEAALRRAGQRSHGGGHALAGLAALLGSRSAWALCLMYGFGVFCLAFFLTVLPAYLHDQRKLSHREVRWLAGLPLACGVVACFLGGVISDWLIRRFGSRNWGRRINGVLGRTCAGLAVLGPAWVEEVWLLAFLLSAAYFFSDLAMGPAWACCASVRALQRRGMHGVGAAERGLSHRCGRAADEPSLGAAAGVAVRPSRWHRAVQRRGGRRPQQRIDDDRTGG